MNSTRSGSLRFINLLVAAAIVATLPSYTALGQQPGALPAGAADKPFTNQDVIRMVKAGLGDDLIIGKIRTSRCQFDTSVEAMLQLKGDGVSENVIRAMVEVGGNAPAPAPEKEPPPDPNNPLAPHDPGIYLPKAQRDAERIVQLEPTAYAQGKTGGAFASAMTYGIAKVKWKAVVRGGKANLRVSEPRPTFYFYFEQKSGSLTFAAPWMAWFGGISSPNQFVLARFEAKKDARELVVGEWGAYGSSMGTRGKDIVEFDFEKLAPGIYKVRPREDLRPGEYCFFYVQTNMLYGAGGGQLFDFGVNPAR